MRCGVRETQRPSSVTTPVLVTPGGQARNHLTSWRFCARGAMFASHASGSTLGAQHERGLRIRGDAAVPFPRGDATAGDRE